MGRRIALELPRRAEVEEIVAAAKMSHQARSGLREEQVALDVRLYGRIADDRIGRIGVGCDMDPDDMGRRPFEIVEPAEHADWRDRVAGEIGRIADRVARLEHRRDSFDADRLRLAPPRAAWDIHPVAASVLSLWRRLPAFDGTHRLDGAIGRYLELAPVPGIDYALAAYGDGVVRLVRAEFSSGAQIATTDGIVSLTVSGMLPTSLRLSAGRCRPRDIAEQLGLDPRTDRVRVKKVQVTEDTTIFTFSDILVPWDRRARGDEAWRRTRGAE